MSAAGYVAVEVSANMHDFSEDGVLFSFHVSALAALRPQQGPLAGGMLLTIVGFDMSHLACLPHGPLTHGDAGLSCAFETNVNDAGFTTQQVVPATQQSTSR